MRTLKSVRIQFNSASHNYVKLDKLGFQLDGGVVSIPFESTLYASDTQESVLNPDTGAVTRSFNVSEILMTGGGYWQSPTNGQLPVYIDVTFSTPITADRIFLGRPTDLDGRASNITLSAVDADDVSITIYSGPVDFNASQTISFPVPKKAAILTPEQQAERDELNLIRERARNSDALDQLELFKLILGTTQDVALVLNILNNGGGFAELTNKKVNGGAELTSTNAIRVLALYYAIVPEDAVERQEFRAKLNQLVAMANDPEGTQKVRFGNFVNSLVISDSTRDMVANNEFVNLLIRRFGTKGDDAQIELIEMAKTALESN